MKKNDLVSIIIPCYNHGQHLEESVQSALEQTYQNIEIIIINDGSTDDTDKIAQGLQNKYPKKIKIITQENSGLSAARNSGIRKSSGAYIVPLDADDLLHRDMVKHCLNTITSSDVDIVYSGYELFGTINRINTLKPFSQNILLYRNAFSATALYRKKVWKKNSGYKENMRGGYEDWEFWINSYKHGFKIQHLPEILFSYLRKEESMVEHANNQSTYLKAKIVMNHPELYTISHTKEAIDTIREVEQSADLYFYSKNNLSEDRWKYFEALCSYLNDNPLGQEQTIKFLEKKILLIDLDLLENPISIKKLSENTNINFVVFYSPIRYNIQSLQACNYAWKRDKGIIEAKGTIFDYVYTKTREDTQMQYTAHRRLYLYQQILLASERQKKIKQQQAQINNLKKTEKQQQALMDLIRKTTKLSLARHPIKKYKAYKSMLKTYFKIKRNQK